ncbi:MAG: Calx-beta domain-containing protein, partial [Planctomycetia bacterium]|nr:Calx-beta domain-containing protein [Planctomycetia bacterium]
GGFAAAQNYSVGVEPTSLAVGDFNHDGLADIATTNWGSDTVSIVRGLAGGTFSLPEYFAVGPGPIALAAGDFNGDGWLDVTTANFFGTNASANTASVLLNDQNWGPVPSYVYISVSDASVTEGKRGVKYLNFTVTLSAASNVPVTVQYATQYGTATSGSDYQAQSGTLTFGVGETVKTVSIAVYGDHTFEADETFQLLLSNPTGNALISDAAGLGTIVNDDFIRGRGNGRRMR